MHDPEWFRSDVLPRLASVKLSEDAEAGPGQRFFWVDVERSDALARLRRDCASRLARHRDIEGTTAVGVLPSQLATRAPRVRLGVSARPFLPAGPHGERGRAGHGVGGTGPGATQAS